MNWFTEILKVWWVSFKSVFQLSYGVYRLSRLSQPIISVFGGKGAYEGGKYTLWAEQFAAECAKKGMSIVTGGGPGIMEAANCGAFKNAKDKKRATLGIGVSGVDEGFYNKCAPLVNVDYFFVRKWLLTHYAQAFVLFPGGIGTVDEFFEVLNLMKLKKMKRVPVILIGKNYWQDLLDWYQRAFESEFISVPPQQMLIITDDIHEAVNLILGTLG